MDWHLRKLRKTGISLEKGHMQKVPKEKEIKPTFEERYGPWICMGCGYEFKGPRCCWEMKKPKAGRRLNENQRN